jgi:hypothetical protein
LCSSAASPSTSAIPPAGYPFWTDIGAAANLSFDHQVGGHLPAPTQISSAIITPTTDVGFTNAAGSSA